MPTLELSPSPERAANPRPSLPTRLLVATAGDDASTGALHVAAELAQRWSAPVMALGVSTPFPHTVTSIVSIQPPVTVDERNRLAMLEQVHRRLRELPGANLWEKRTVVGWPGDAINNAAVSWKASMIVLGIGHHGAVGRLFGAETAAAVIKRARIPVLAVNAKARTLPRIACAAVDFTPASIAAAILTGNVLAPDGELTLVHVCAFKGVRSKQGDLVDIYRTGARAKLDEAVAEVSRRTGRQVSGEMLEGEPGDAIVEFAAGTDCGLIALGGHEQGLMDRILIGSIRTRVLRSAKCSVLVAPPVTED